MNAVFIESLLAELSHGTPELRGARCRGRGHLFDPREGRESPETVQARHAQALGLCRSCEALTACKSWLDGLPRSRKPLGVIAGTIRQPKEI